MIAPRDHDGPRAAAVEEVEAWFDCQPDLDVERPDDSSWFVVLAGERKRTIPVHLGVGAHNLVVQSFFMRAPDENEAEVFRYLLARNTRTYVFRFALTEDGDVMLLAVAPLHAVTTGEVDRMLGQLLELADGAFNPTLRLGFEGYIEREQAWRARVGAGRNPIS